MFYNPRVENKSTEVTSKLTNTLELKAAIMRAGITQREVAELIGMSYYSFHLKLHNAREFKASEINALYDVLNLTLEEQQKIFFN